MKEKIIVTITVEPMFGRDGVSIYIGDTFSKYITDVKALVEEIKNLLNMGPYTIVYN